MLSSTNTENCSFLSDFISTGWFFLIEISWCQERYKYSECIVAELSSEVTQYLRNSDPDEPIITKLGTIVQQHTFIYKSWKLLIFVSVP